MYAHIDSACYVHVSMGGGGGGDIRIAIKGTGDKIEIPDGWVIIYRLGDAVASVLPLRRHNTSPILSHATGAIFYNIHIIIYIIVLVRYRIFLHISIYA